MALHIGEQQTLVDRSTQAALERRGRELLGLALGVVGFLLVAMLVSYHPADPSPFSATSQATRNWVGDLGAYVAALIMMMVGWGGWAIPVLLIVWGVRLGLHRGDGRLPNALVFGPVWVVVAAVYAAGHPPPAGWTYGFGPGGFLGDIIMGPLLSLVPLSIGLSLTVVQIGLGIFLFLLGSFVLGFTIGDLWRVFCFLGSSLLLICVMFLRLVGIYRPGVRVAPQPTSCESVIDDAPEMTQLPLVVRRVPFMSRLRRTHPVADGIPSELVDVDRSDLRVSAPAPDRIASRIGEAIRSRPARMGISDDTFSLGPDPLVIETDGRREPSLGALGSDLGMDGVQASHSDSMLTATTELDSAGLAMSRKLVQPVQKRAPLSRQAQAEAQPDLFAEGSKQEGFELPPLGLLMNPDQIERYVLSDDALEQNARMLEAVLDDYGVKGEIVSVRPGPVVTMYELEPAPGLKASRVIGLADDIARSMSALSARVSTLPGRSVIGIELPNDKREMVSFREILAARDYGDGKHKLPLALGKDIGGDPVVANLAKMPHLLIAGTTGSGKSVAINTMILSLLYKLSPSDCRMIMIDPKMLELSVYDGIPHLLSPVVTDPKKAVVALKWVVAEMEDRYTKMSKMGVRNIDGYNSRVEDALSRGEMFSRTMQTGFDDETGDPVFETEEFEPKKLPFIVVIVDEMADLMMVAGKEIEACIQRLAQMARASGIHLIMATQRPSVDVITGTIKANFPTRISFQVTSKIDSRTILGEMGAEQLLGMGDMLYMGNGAKITRCHGPFVSDEEVEEVVTHLKAFGSPDYVNGVVDGPNEEQTADIDAVLGLNAGGNTGGEDALYDQAVAIVLRDRKCSTSYIQRKLGIGYNKAARLVEQMEDERVVSGSNHVGKREILVPEQT
jgi:S-DNA-T family DNA segregation ATPase FtsK/SpoIIIE